MSASCPFFPEADSGTATGFGKILLNGAPDPNVDFAAQYPKINWLGQKRLGAILRRLPLCLASPWRSS
jgi:hypothetical protein